jgi:SAM-dependent methyltransferase
MLDKKGNFKLYGTEMQGKAAERTPKSGKIKLKIGKLDANDFPHNSFDAITLFQVFEHLTEPKNTLDIVSKIIKPKGILIISFPNIDSFQSRIFKGKWIHLDPPRHLFFFKPNDFFAEMKKYGFNLINQGHYSMEYNPYGMQQSILNCIIKKRDVLYEYLKGNKDYIKDYSKLNLFLQSMFFKITFPIFVISDLFESYFRKGAVVQFVFRKI